MYRSLLFLNHKNLEQELGVVLFDRVKKRIVLNEQGKEFYDKVSKGLNLIDSAVDGLSVTPDSEMVPFP